MSNYAYAITLSVLFMSLSGFAVSCNHAEAVRAKSCSDACVGYKGYVSNLAECACK